MAFKVGDAAPEFSQTAHDGKTITVGPQGERVVVLYFYPKDETYGCTAQACSFRDNFEAFVDAGAQVVGVSGDSQESHRAFASNHRLPFSLLSDTQGELRRSFGVKRTLGLMPGRVTFVIDKAGVIRHTFNSQLKAKTHVDEALTVVKQLD